MTLLARQVSALPKKTWNIWWRISVIVILSLWFHSREEERWGKYCQPWLWWMRCLSYAARDSGTGKAKCLSHCVPHLFLLGVMHVIRSVNLLNNRLTGLIPVAMAIWRLSSTVMLAANQLSGAIPDTLIHSWNMGEYLQININRLTGLPRSCAMAIHHAETLKIAPKFPEGCYPRHGGFLREFSSPRSVKLQQQWKTWSLRDGSGSNSLCEKKRQWKRKRRIEREREKKKKSLCPLPQPEEEPFTLQRGEQQIIVGHSGWQASQTKHQGLRRKLRREWSGGSGPVFLHKLEMAPASFRVGVSNIFS